jgi:uncharacterized membrane protein
MKRLLRDLALILVLAGLWAVSGYMIGVALETAGISYPPLKVILASLNVIMGMLLFQGITRDPTAERIFFNGPEPDGEGDMRVGCLWLIPASLLFFGLLMWVWAIILRFVLFK